MGVDVGSTVCLAGQADTWELLMVVVENGSR